MEKIGETIARQIAQYRSDVTARQARERHSYAEFTQASKPVSQEKLPAMLRRLYGEPEPEVLSGKQEPVEWDPPPAAPIEEPELTLIRNRHSIRPGVMACETIPEGLSYCGGEWHHVRKQGETTRLYYWEAKGRCPVAAAEAAIVRRNVAAPPEDDAKKSKLRRGAEQKELDGRD